MKVWYFCFTCCCALIFGFSGCEDEREPPVDEQQLDVTEVILGTSSSPYQFFFYSAKTSDNGVVVAFGKRNAAGTQDDMYVEKYSSEGMKIWSKKISDTYTVTPYTVIETQEGGLLVGAARQRSIQVLDTEIMLFKFSSDGEEQWRKTFEPERGEIPSQTAELSNGDIYIAVESYPTSFYMLVRPTGEVIYKRPKDGFGECGNGFNFVALPGNELLFGAPNILRITSNGELTFCRPIAFYPCEGPRTISNYARMIDGNEYLLVGTVETPISIEFVDGSCVRTERGDVFVARMSADGVITKSNELDLAVRDHGRSFDLTSDGGMIILSNGSSQSGMSTDVHIAKVNVNFQLEWEESFNYSSMNFNNGFLVHTLSENRYAFTIASANNVNLANELRLVFVSKKQG